MKGTFKVKCVPIIHRDDSINYLTILWYYTDVEAVKPVCLK